MMLSYVQLHKNYKINKEYNVQERSNPTFEFNEQSPYLLCTESATMSCSSVIPNTSQPGTPSVHPCAAVEVPTHMEEDQI